MLHLLKEKTKPVPKNKKRRKIDVLPIPGQEPPILVIPPFNRQSAAPDKQDGNEESKEPYRSKRNKTPVTAFL